MMLSLVSRRGGTLPMVILLLTVMTIALAAAYTLNGTEAQIGDDYEEQVAALALAESGRHRFLTDRAGLGFTTTPPGMLNPATPLVLTREVDTIPYTGGRAIVTLTPIRAQVGQLPPLYLLTSRGVRDNGGPGDIPPAERTVAQYVYWDLAPINVLAGWTSLTGIKKNGDNPGSMVGVDANPGGVGCPANVGSVAAIAVPTTPGFQGTTTNLTGSPQIKYLGDAASTKDAVDIDWPAIYDMTADITYDLIIPTPNSWPAASAWTNLNYWPTIRINGDYTLGSSGRGTLIVTGNLNMNSVNAQWEGVVLVGGTLTSNGASGVNGATITGLNVMRGVAVPLSDIGNGQKSYKFNSCNAARALRQQAKLRPLPNTWMDNWASY
jgi:hypothetical protein